jgi:hypothetical protein
VVLGLLHGRTSPIQTNEKEFYTTYWNKKLEFFIETSKAASTMATTTSVDNFRTARSDYWELFYGRLSLVAATLLKPQCKPSLHWFRPTTSPLCLSRHCNNLRII